MKITTRIVAATLMLGLVLAAPLASALAWGVDAGQGVTDVKQAGAPAQLGQTWVGSWMKQTGWTGFENDLRTMRDNGVTPVVLWYYWGDAISVSCVQYGCNGNSKSEWDAMARDMAARANAIMAGKPYYIVLEPEFNKNGISSWETFDGYLADQANAIRSISPSAKLVVGFGNWGGWDIFDRAVGASDLVGFQLLYASTRTPGATATASGDTMVTLATTLQARFGKPILVFDFDVASYGGWEGVQSQAIQGVVAKSSQLEAQGVLGVVWRYVRDNTYSSGYFGPAESTWGLEYSNGAHKSSYAALTTALQSGGSIVTAATSVVASAPPPVPTSSSAAFTNVRGNDWWVESDVAGSPVSVTATLAPGGTLAMTQTSWGSWAVSAHAPTGSLVTLVATYGDGSSATALYSWPSATPIASTGAAPAVAGSSPVTFSGVTGNAWWVQVDVSSKDTVASVSVRVDGGAWVALSKQWWGAWARSVHVPAGSSVQFQATTTSGATTLSSPTTW